MAGSEHSGWPSGVMERPKEKEFAISFDKKETKKEDLWSLSDMIREYEKNRGCSMCATQRRLGRDYVRTAITKESFSVGEYILVPLLGRLCKRGRSTLKSIPAGGVAYEM